MPGIYIPTEMRQLVMERARGLCEYCLSYATYSIQPFVIEHVTPRSRGGGTTIDNLAYACGGCNGHKYNKTKALDPIDGALVALFNPRKDKWQDQFVWSDDFTLIIGLTPTGRATVNSLHLNREGIINLRRLLVGIGKHPPDFD